MFLFNIHVRNDILIFAISNIVILFCFVSLLTAFKFFSSWNKKKNKLEDYFWTYDKDKKSFVTNIENVSIFILNENTEKIKRERFKFQQNYSVNTNIKWDRHSLGQYREFKKKVHFFKYF